MAIAYLEQAKLGRARWWDFAFGAWFIFVGWQVVQLLVVSPFLSGATVTPPPDLQDRLDDYATANALAIDLGSLFAVLGLIATPLAYLLSRTLEGTASKVFGVIGIVALALSLVGVGLLSGFMAIATDDGGASTAFIGESATAYAATLASFGGAIGVAVLVQRFIHFRTFTSLLTAARRVRWSRIVWTWALTWGVYAFGTFISVTVFGAEVYANPERSRMLPFVVATLLFIPIQCAAEEIIFRGYLNQALGRFIPSALVVFAITSLAFGALHLANPEIGDAREEGIFWLVFATYILFGFLLSLMVWIDNGLESAIGVHIGNNAWAAMVINYEGSVLPIPGLFLSVTEYPRDLYLGTATLAAVLLGVWLTRRPLGERGEVALPLPQPYRYVPEPG